GQRSEVPAAPARIVGVRSASSVEPRRDARGTLLEDVESAVLREQERAGPGGCRSGWARPLYHDRRAGDRQSYPDSAAESRGERRSGSIHDRDRPAESEQGLLVQPDGTDPEAVRE